MSRAAGIDVGRHQVEDAAWLQPRGNARKHLPGLGNKCSTTWNAVTASNELGRYGASRKSPTKTSAPVRSRAAFATTSDISTPNSFQAGPLKEFRNPPALQPRSRTEPDSVLEQRRAAAAPTTRIVPRAGDGPIVVAAVVLAHVAGSGRIRETHERA